MDNYKKLFKSFLYAFSGIGRTILKERNMRIHLVCLTYMFSILIFSDWFVISRLEYAVLVLASGTVIAGELFNTAIENAVNHAGTEITEYAKVSKDAAAGAVLISAIFAVIAGFIIMFQPDAFRKMHSYFSENPVMLCIFALSIVPATLFIFFGLPINKRK